MSGQSIDVVSDDSPRRNRIETNCFTIQCYSCNATAESIFSMLTGLCANEFVARGYRRELPKCIAVPNKFQTECLYVLFAIRLDGRLVPHAFCVKKLRPDLVRVFTSFSATVHSEKIVETPVYFDVTLKERVPNCQFSKEDFDTMAWWSLPKQMRTLIGKKEAFVVLWEDKANGAFSVYSQSVDIDTIETSN